MNLKIFFFLRGPSEHEVGVPW